MGLKSAFLSIQKKLLDASYTCQGSLQEQNGQKNLCTLKLDLPAVVLVVQQWLSSDEEAKNLIAAQSTHKAGCLSWSPFCFGILKKQILMSAKACFFSRKDELMSKSEGKQAKSKAILLPCSFPQVATRKARLRFRVDILTLNNQLRVGLPTKINPSQVFPIAWFQLIPN